MKQVFTLYKADNVVYQQFYEDGVPVGENQEKIGASYIGEEFIECLAKETYIITMEDDVVTEAGWPRTTIQVGDVISTPYCKEGKVMAIDRIGNDAKVEISYNGMMMTHYPDGGLLSEYVDGRCIKAVTKRDKRIVTDISEVFDEDHFLVTNTAEEGGKILVKRVTIVPRFSRSRGCGSLIRAEYYGKSHIWELGVSLDEDEYGIFEEVKDRAKSAMSA